MLLKGIHKLLKEILIQIIGLLHLLYLLAEIFHRPTHDCRMSKNLFDMVQVVPPFLCASPLKNQCVWSFTKWFYKMLISSNINLNIFCIDPGYYTYPYLENMFLCVKKQRPILESTVYPVWIEY